MAHEVADNTTAKKGELRMENGQPVDAEYGGEECPVCGDGYVHATEPPQNKSSVSGMHVCYSVEDGNQLVMYIHGERQSIHANDDFPPVEESEESMPRGDEIDEYLGGGPGAWKEANPSAEEMFDPEDSG